MVGPNHSIQWWWCLWNHWHFGMVAKTGPRKSEKCWFFLQVCKIVRGRGFIHLLSVSLRPFVKKGNMLQLGAFLRYFLQPKQLQCIVDLCTSIWKTHWKLIEINAQFVRKNQWWWFSGGKTFEKSTISMFFSGKILHPIFWWKKYYHWSLTCIVHLMH